MGETKHDGLAIPGRVVLAHEPPFRLGSARVHPSTRQFITADDQLTLEPRVMQVLVALFRAGGEVLTRDEMVDRCWDGRIVGDDAVNRVISRIRQLAQHGAAEFKVETIPRVGYRIVPRDTGGSVLAAPLPAARDVSPADPSRRRLVLAAGCVAIGASGLGLTVWRSSVDVHQPSPQAKLYYQRGIEERGQNSLAHGEQAVAYFKQAAQIDPHYAQAWGALAWGYRTLLEYGPRSDADRLALFARSAAQRALDLDPDDPDAKAALIMLPPFYGNWAAIERGCRGLLARHPTHNITRFNLAHVLAQTGRWRDAIPHLQELVAGEPFWPLARMQLFRALRSAGRLDEAEKQLRIAEEQWPRRGDAWSAKLRHLVLSERGEDAAALLRDENSYPTDSSSAAIEWDLVVVRAYLSGSTADKQRASAMLLSWVRKAPTAGVFAALDCSMLGDLDSAFALLDGYYFGRGPWSEVRWSRPTTDILFNVMTTPMRSDSRFVRLLEETGLEGFWRNTGVQPDYRRFA